MKVEKKRIRIESINGGHSVYDYTAGKDEYYDSLGIFVDNNRAALTLRGAGPSVLSPSRPRSITGTLTGVPMWMQGNPKNGNIYVYDMNGSVYTLTSSISGLGDLNDGGSAGGNGMAYYDNFMYFARETTVARYGPLNGTSSFTDDYWITTLGKTALEQQAYPDRDNGFTDARYPNHVMHRHKDGKLYFADTVGGQGVIHYIKTSKTTVEGDTDSGSTYNALDLPFGYFITDIESLGDDLVISAFESRSILNTTAYTGSSYEGRSALFFWDTASDSYYKVIQNEFPDQIITALQNANGVLYVFSADIGSQPSGARVCRYLGGNSFEQVTVMSDIDSPIAGGTVAQLNQIFFGSVNYQDPLGVSGCVWAIGTQNQPLSNAVFNVCGARHSTQLVYAMTFDDGGAPWSKELFFGYANNNSSGYIAGFNGNESSWDTDLYDKDIGNAYWKSQWYKIGSKFKIRKIKLFLVNDSVDSGNDLRVYVVTDNTSGNGGTSTQGTLVGTINNSNYPSHLGPIILKQEVTGEHSFQIVIRWFGTNSLDISLPIEIEFETYDTD